jgi:hypothetical protein
VGPDGPSRVQLLEAGRGAKESVAFTPASAAARPRSAINRRWTSTLDASGRASRQRGGLNPPDPRTSPDSTPAALPRRLGAVHRRLRRGLSNARCERHRARRRQARNRVQPPVVMFTTRPPEWSISWFSVRVVAVLQRLNVSFAACDVIPPLRSPSPARRVVDATLDATACAGPVDGDHRRARPTQASRAVGIPLRGSAAAR